ncbi:uncharacterized protein LOC112555305 isoform X2 [Pomacea canaliculata]|uniref:uncharacterized protein LOC112555305 isoform X2 n=1 Tax=Pomacea canaliculata TaxID=400727 RepID=UPI000D7331E5|nr:uncharacterized protein LOC112555305 isoform X2 [Pomacea canaliculata]
MTQLPLAVGFTLLGLTFCFPQLQGDKPQAAKEAGVLPPLNPQLAQLIVEKIREELPKPSEEITENLFKSFVSYLYERHEYEEAKKLQVKAESQDAQAAFKAVLAHLQQVASQQEPAENTPLGFQAALLQADPEEKEDDPELKAIKLKSLFKLLLNYKSYLKVGQEIVKLGLPKEKSERLFFESFVEFLCDSKEIVLTAQKKLAVQQWLKDAQEEASSSRVSRSKTRPNFASFSSS